VELVELLKLKKESPEKFRETILSLPEDTKRLFLHYADVLKASSEFSPEGYKAFFDVIFSSELPDHAYYGWIIPLFYSKGLIERERFVKYYEGRGEKFAFVMDKCLEYEVPKTGMVTEAFRESIKTTALTIGFTAYFIGHHPDRANLLIQVGDDTAKLNAGKVAEIIMDNPGWKAVFPNVVPDKDSAWGDKGYDIKRIDIPYGEWKKLIAKRRDNTLVGLGYSSRSNIGKHPDGVLMIDDIMDENNSSSQKELQVVLQILNSTIFFMMTKITWVVFVGTPWVDGDVLDYVKDTGEYIETKIPAYWENDSGTTYAWEKERGQDWVASKRKTTVSSEFARMVLLDLTKAGSGSLKYYPYLSESVSFDWPIVGGADPTNVMPNAFDGKKRSHFALAYVAKLPQGGAVVLDGVLEQCSQIEAENYIAQAQTKFPRYSHTAIENVGGGALFIQVVRRNSALRIIDSDLHGFLKKGGRIRSKADRILIEMAPWFENGVVRISTAQTPFLNALRRLFDRFYDLDPKSDESFDCGDAVYHALKSMPEVLIINSDPSGLPDMYKKPKISMWSGLGSA